MNHKLIAIDADLHTQIKAMAALLDMSIKDFADEALRKALPNERLLPFDNPPRRLVDPAVEYETEE